MKSTIALLFIVIFVWACSSSTTENNDSAPDKVSKTKMGSEKEWSELALLMRQIHEDAKVWKTELDSGRMVIDSVRIYESLVESTPTNPSVGGPVFKGFASQYQSSVDEFLSAKDIVLAKAAYNNLVTSCLSCHSEYCPGPMKTIRKLKVATN